MNDSINFFKELEDEQQEFDSTVLKYDEHLDYLNTGTVIYIFKHNHISYDTLVCAKKNRKKSDISIRDIVTRYSKNAVTVLFRSSLKIAITEEIMYFYKDVIMKMLDVNLKKACYIFFSGIKDKSFSFGVSGRNYFNNIYFVNTVDIDKKYEVMHIDIYNMSTEYIMININVIVCHLTYIIDKYLINGGDIILRTVMIRNKYFYDFLAVVNSCFDSMYICYNKNFLYIRGEVLIVLKNKKNNIANKSDPLYYPRVITRTSNIYKALNSVYKKISNNVIDINKIYISYMYIYFNDNAILDIFVNKLISKIMSIDRNKIKKIYMS